jgi:hypothetical protein
MSGHVALLQPVGHWDLPSVARNRRAEAGCSSFSFIFLIFFATTIPYL